MMTFGLNFRNAFIIKKKIRNMFVEFQYYNSTKQNNNNSLIKFFNKFASSINLDKDKPRRFLEYLYGNRQGLVLYECTSKERNKCHSNTTLNER